MGSTFQHHGIRDRDVSDGAAGGRDSRIGGRQQFDGGDQAAGDRRVLCGGEQVHSSFLLEAFCAEWISGRADGRRDCVLHVYRIRFGVDGGGGVQGAEARPADRNPDFAFRVRVFLHRGGAGADRNSALEHSRQCGASGKGSRSDRIERGEPLGDGGRADGDDLVDSGFSAGAGAGVVRDVERGAVARSVLARSQESSHAGRSYLGCGRRGRDSRRDFRYRHARRSLEHRHALRVYSSVDRCADSTKEPAGTRARIPSAVESVDSDRVGGVLLRADGELDGGKLAAVFRLAGDWAGGVPLLRAEAQRAVKCEAGGGRRERRGAVILRAIRRRAYAGVAPVMIALLVAAPVCFGWGENAERLIANKAVDTLPDEMLGYFGANRQFLVQHVTDTDEGNSKAPTDPRNNFIQLDHYGQFPFSMLPRSYTAAVAKYGRRTIQTYGLLPWQIGLYSQKLTDALRDHN